MVGIVPAEDFARRPAEHESQAVRDWSVWAGNSKAGKTLPVCGETKAKVTKYHPSVVQNDGKSI